MAQRAFSVSPAQPLSPSDSIISGSSFGLAVHWLSGFPISLPWWKSVLGVGSSASVGIFFWLFPAFKPSGLDPIEALRYEPSTVFGPPEPREAGW